MALSRLSYRRTRLLLQSLFALSLVSTACQVPESLIFLNRLKEELDDKHFAFFDGSKVIDDVVPGGLEGFKKLSTRKKIF
jgi:hypothetical protein